MKKAINSFYLSKITFTVSAVVAIVSFFAWFINRAMYNKPETAVCSFFYFALELLLVIAYKKGETNIQKMLIGGLLTFLTFDLNDLFVQYISTDSYLTTIIYTAVIACISVIIFIAHIIQQLDHTGKSAGFIVNQCCGILIIFTIFHEFEFVYYGTTNISNVLWTVGSAATYVFIIAIETRIKEYKTAREVLKAENAWTDEVKLQNKKAYFHS